MVAEKLLSSRKVQELLIFDSPDQVAFLPRRRQPVCSYHTQIDILFADRTETNSCDRLHTFVYALSSISGDPSTSTADKECNQMVFFPK